MAKSNKNQIPEQKELESKSLPIEFLELNRGQIYGLPKNPRFIRDDRFEALKKSISDNPEMLEMRELLVYPFDEKYIVIGGNMRLRACIELGIKDVPCKVLPTETPVEKLRAYTMKDNIAFGETDWDALANEWDLSELKDFGMTLDGIDAIEESSGSESDGQYTKKIEIPQYEPTQEMPPKLEEMFDRAKYNELVDRIEQSDVPDEVKEFLRFAASRHIVFNYQNIAEFYAHADAETQALMEDSALVIIDFNDAMQKGFVDLQSKISELICETEGSNA